ncbi:MAG: sigma-70 family RNA polymerase sigma factor [Gemmatimonadota bacterium]|nr:sigma-70 family RNA polymerase sigma factor [Gemmatimonadota bacterium]
MNEGRTRFEEEALPHLDAVYRFALRLAGSAAQAEDLVQDTFLRAFKSWDQYTTGTQCKSWLFTICRNVFLRQRERALRHDEIVEEGSRHHIDPVTRENPVFAATQQKDPERDFFDHLIDRHVVLAIQGLPDDYRMAVVLSDVEGLPYAEIAQIMEVPVGTIKSRLFRGRRLLQEKLRDYATEMGYIQPKVSGG